MIYLDSSVVLAYLFAEDRLPPEAMWRERLVSSRLLEYESWNRIHTRGLARSHGEQTRALLSRATLIDLTPPVLARALKSFPTPVGTLDGLHMSTIEFLRAHGEDDVQLASFDRRMNACARGLGIQIYAL